MEDLILISNLNDFIFCPVSIYFHMLYGSADKLTYQSRYQIDGTKVHETVDKGKYSTKKNVLTALDVYSEKYGFVGKIDIFDATQKLLIERKKHVSQVYDGYVFQLYAQYYAMTEMGYEIKKIKIHSIDDNRNYDIELPNNNVSMKLRFEELINAIRTFSMNDYIQTNAKKCNKCIYTDACDRALIKGDELC